MTSCVKPRAYTVYTAVAMPSAQTALLAGEHRTIVGDDLYVQYFLWNCAVHTRPTGTRMDCHDVVVEYGPAASSVSTLDGTVVGQPDHNISPPEDVSKLECVSVKIGVLDRNLCYVPSEWLAPRSRTDGVTWTDHRAAVLVDVSFSPGCALDPTTVGVPFGMSRVGPVDAEMVGGASWVSQTYGDEVGRYVGVRTTCLDVYQVVIRGETLHRGKISALNSFVDGLARHITNVTDPK